MLDASLEATDPLSRLPWGRRTVFWERKSKPKSTAEPTVTVMPCHHTWEELQTAFTEGKRVVCAYLCSPTASTCLILTFSHYFSQHQPWSILNLSLSKHTKKKSMLKFPDPYQLLESTLHVNYGNFANVSQSTCFSRTIILMTYRTKAGPLKVPSAIQILTQAHHPFQGGGKEDMLQGLQSKCSDVYSGENKEL